MENGWISLLWKRQIGQCQFSPIKLVKYLKNSNCSVLVFFFMKCSGFENDSVSCKLAKFTY